MTKWQEISDVLTPEGIDKLKAGQVLMFMFEGSKTHLKIKRKTKDGKVWAEETRLYTKRELDDMLAEEYKVLMKGKK